MSKHICYVKIFEWLVWRSLMWICGYFVVLSKQMGNVNKKITYLPLSVTLMYYNCIHVPDIYITNVWSSAGNRSSITLTVSLRITSMQSPGSTDGRCQTTECSAACISLLHLDMGRYHTNSTDLRICLKPCLHGHRYWHKIASRKHVNRKILIRSASERNHIWHIPNERVG